MTLNFDADVASKLAKLNDSMQSIQSVSLWLVFHRKQHERAHALWRAELKQASPAKQLILLYLANDVLQSSRKKGDEVRSLSGCFFSPLFFFFYKFSNSFQTTIVTDVALVFQSADMSTRAKIERLVQVWLDRAVFPLPVISALQAALRTSDVANLVDDDELPSQPQPPPPPPPPTTTTFDSSIADDVQVARLATQVSALNESMLDVPLESKSSSIVGLGPAQLRQRLSRAETRRQSLMRIADALDARCTRRESAIVAANAVLARQTTRLADERRVALRVKAWLDSTNSLIERLDSQVNLSPDYDDEDQQVDNDDVDVDVVDLSTIANRLTSLEAQASQASDALSSSQSIATNQSDKLMQLIETDLFGEEDHEKNQHQNKKARVMI
jgi:hypothetical protein